MRYGNKVHFKADLIGEKVTKRVAAAGIRLRFDKVALRLLDDVREGVSETLREDQSIAFTITAPIKLPAKTSTALQELLRQLRTVGLSTTINGNEVRARMIMNASSHMPRVIGFVHNPEINADIILEIAETILRER